MEVVDMGFFINLAFSSWRMFLVFDPPEEEIILQTFKTKVEI